MNYKLIKEEPSKIENLIGITFFIKALPHIGEKLYAIHDENFCLITTEVRDGCIRGGGNLIEIETKDAKYTFEKAI